MSGPPKKRPLIFQHFVYHDRQKSSMIVLIDHEIGNAGALMRVTERATLVVKKRARDDDTECGGGVTALQAARGVEVSVNPEGLRHHLQASDNMRSWIKLRLQAQKYE
jgi:hypothetical protein